MTHYVAFKDGQFVFGEMRQGGEPEVVIDRFDSATEAANLCAQLNAASRSAKAGMVEPERLQAPYRRRARPGAAPDVVEDGRVGTVFWKMEGNDETEDAGPATLSRGNDDEPLFNGRWVSSAEADSYAFRNGHAFKGH